jgi:chemotaxis response regulator CheB
MANDTSKNKKKKSEPKKDEPAKASPAKEPNKFLVVGLGASAGGIQALKVFFTQVPEDSGS